MTADSKEATINLASTEDKRSVPTRDFVLYLRDDLVNVPVGLLNVLQDGD